MHRPILYKSGNVSIAYCVFLSNLYNKGMRKRITKTGPELLGIWAARFETKTAAADRLGLTPMEFSHWIHGRRRPSLDRAVEVERITKGAVPVKAWVSRHGGKLA